MQRSQCGPLDWTPWINSDTPWLDGCDVETLSRLWQKYPEVICKQPTAIDVREATTGEPFVPSSIIEVNIASGFKCCSKLGKNCLDYEVRFCCPKGKSFAFLFHDFVIK